jgi:RNA polymerase sigma-70 factor, ECF subfamily
MIAMQAGERTAPRSLRADPESFRSFYDAALPHVYGYFLRRSGGSVATAEDLTQETFMAAVGELRKGRRADVPLAWILGIARHKLVDHYRRQSRTERTLVLDEDVELVVGAADGTRELAVSALAKVPSAQRAALVLRHLDGLSVPEVASALGRSVEAAESLLARGRISFKRAYAEADA